MNSLLSEPIVHHAIDGAMLLSEDDPEIGKDVCMMAIMHNYERIQTTPMKAIGAHGSSKVYVLKTKVSKDYVLERGKAMGERDTPTIDLICNPRDTGHTTSNFIPLARVRANIASVEDTHMIALTCTPVSHVLSSSNAKTQKDSTDTVILEDDDEVVAAKDENYALVSRVTYIRSIGR